MNSSDTPSLSSQLMALEAQHRSLDEEIGRLQEFPYNDQLRLQRLKRQKLLLKQNIQRIRALLIPDLDA